FRWANAVIDGDQIVVSEGKVPNPQSVRYGWAENPYWANLINREGLPASPFRTDDWEGITDGSR
ncbi:MAG: sialate O-acetylesterase, partial [Planctomycetota bacterium]